MKKELMNWTVLLDDKLTEKDMNKIRGGTDPEDPNGPIIK